MTPTTAPPMTPPLTATGSGRAMVMVTSQFAPVNNGGHVHV